LLPGLPAPGLHGGGFGLQVGGGGGFGLHGGGFGLQVGGLHGGLLQVGGFGFGGGLVA